MCAGRVVETDTGTAISHKLAPGYMSPGSIDADGFRAVDNTPIDGHRSWIKIVDFSTADVRNRDGELTRGCFLCRDVLDSEFGNITIDNTSGWGTPISPLQPMNQPSMEIISTDEFLQSFSKVSEIKETFSCLGVARLESPENFKTILFSPDSRSAEWVPIPVELIDSVEVLNKKYCPESQQKHVQLNFKIPSDNQLANLLASLYLHEQKQSIRTSQETATLRIDVNFTSNGNGTLHCGAGTFRCQGQPGRRYPRDLTITPSDKHGTHYSNEFNVLMHYSILIWGQVGIYIHEWSYCDVASGPTAGCIHLCRGDAEQVYNSITGRTRILINYPWQDSAAIINSRMEFCLFVCVCVAGRDVWTWLSG